MSVDLACAGRAFLDLTFVGLPELPGPGQERFASELLRSPGGSAIVAVGGARLGLSTALASPLGDDEAGRFVQAELEAEGVRVAGRRVQRTPATVVLPLDGDRSMVTFDPGASTGREELAALAPRAVVADLTGLDVVPEAAALYVGLGDRGGRAPGPLPAGLERARALLANEAEARWLTGARSPEAAIRALGEATPVVVVTLGAQGALAWVEGELLRAPGERMRVVDSTGAGDLFAAVWVWGELAGLDPETRLRYAVLYAALSVTVPTGAGSAATLERLLEEGARRGLPPVDRVAPAGATPLGNDRSITGRA